MMTKERYAIIREKARQRIADKAKPATVVKEGNEMVAASSTQAVIEMIEKAG